MKNLDDLKEVWRTQPGIDNERFDLIIQQVRSTSSVLKRKILRRDLTESLASLIVLCGFAPGLWTSDNWVSWSGHAIMCAAGLTIPTVLWWARRRASSSAVPSFVEVINIEIDFLGRQIALLRNVTWWYLLPIFVGMVLIMLGVVRFSHTIFETVFLTIFLTVCGAIFVGIWKLNQTARVKNLQPLREYYVQILSGIESDTKSLLEMPAPPASFLDSEPHTPLSRRARRIWILVTLLATLSVLALSVLTITYFDSRTGYFVLSTAPVVGILIIYVSGLWKRGPEQ